MTPSEDQKCKPFFYSHFMLIETIVKLWGEYSTRMELYCIPAFDSHGGIICANWDVCWKRMHSKHCNVPWISRQLALSLSHSPGGKISNYWAPREQCMWKCAEKRCGDWNGIDRRRKSRFPGWWIRLLLILYDTFISLYIWCMCEYPWWWCWVRCVPNTFNDIFVRLNLMLFVLRVERIIVARCHCKLLRCYICTSITPFNLNSCLLISIFRFLYCAPLKIARPLK